MLSLYIHIPFCYKKCGYCSFPVIPLERIKEPLGMATHYQLALFRDIQNRGTKINTKDERNKIKTLYFGGGTPMFLGSVYILEILSEIKKHFDLSTLEELTIECNPYPYEETLLAVQEIIQACGGLPRIRFSFGIQSLNNAILTKSNRDCTYEGIMSFTNRLIEIKTDNVVYNYDFISFGGDTYSFQRLKDLAKSNVMDSYSLYSLELFPGAKRYHDTKDPLIAYQAPRDHDMPFSSSEDSIFDEFSELKQIFLDAGYNRYEISNYALPGKESIHNTTYRTMDSYLGLGLGAHSFLRKGVASKQDERLVTTGGWKKYISGDAYVSTSLSQEDLLIESFFLGLRMKAGVNSVSKYKTILHEDIQKRIQKLVDEGLVTYNQEGLALTDTGMNLHHRVCDYLMKKV